MKILKAEVFNFGPYSHLEFSFDNLGLAALTGPTGVGKSHVLDIVPWILFGTTAKNGAVDDIRSWQSEEEENTSGTLTLLLDSTYIHVYRTKGRRSDVYWAESDEADSTEHRVVRRGKDTSDTQKLLEARLGISADRMLIACYFHEFSTSGTFFTSSAKIRRELLESLTDLSFPSSLSTKCTGTRKSKKLELEEMEAVQEKLMGRIEQLRQSVGDTEGLSNKWEKEQKIKIKDLKLKSKTFEGDKACRIENISRRLKTWVEGINTEIEAHVENINNLEAIVKPTKQFDTQESEIRNSLRCQSCGSLPNNLNEALGDIREKRVNNNKALADLKRVKADLVRLRDTKNPFLAQLKACESEHNQYLDLLEEQEQALNPFKAHLLKLKHSLAQYEQTKAKTDADLSELGIKIDALSHLYDLSFVLRGELLRKVINQIQDKTNYYLEKYFDAEIRVGFALAGGDSLDVTIQKSGYECNYKQLSRGQRSILRLCFGISIMKASANQAGQHFSLLMFDEVLDGMSTDLKLKAVSLFEELSVEHNSVLVIDHATEVKNAFNKKYTVSTIRDSSVIYEE